MNNKIFIGFATFFATILLIIVGFNLFDSDARKMYSFERKFASKDSILHFEKKYKKMNENEYVMYVNSDHFFAERDVESIDDKNDSYKFFTADLSFKNKYVNDLILPKQSNILFCNPNKIIFTNHFKLFVHQNTTKVISEIKLNNIKLISLKPIINSETKFLCFAECFINNVYKTGFYVIDFTTGEIKLSKELETDTVTSLPKNALRYSGNFAAFKDEGIISYYCDKYSKIYFFDANGFFLKELNTLDKTPLPNVIKNKQGLSFYSREGTWFSNMGLFIKGKNVFVFSASDLNVNTIIIDEYTYDNLQYVKSHKLYYDNQDSSCIRSVFVDNNRIIIGLEFYYASFIFSRHI